MGCRLWGRTESDTTEATLAALPFLVTVSLFSTSAGVQPQLIQGIRRRDGIGEGQETTA